MKKIILIVYPFLIVLFLSLYLTESFSEEMNIPQTEEELDNNFLSGLYEQQVIDANRLLLDSVKPYYPKSLNVEGVKKALKEGADPNSTEENNNYSVLSSLSWSCSGADQEKEKKCVEIAKLLFQHGAKLQNIYGDRIILYTPIADGLYDFTELLLKNGASATEEIAGELPIEIAERRGQSKIVNLLVKYGAKRISKKKAIQLRFIQCASISDSGIKCMQEALRNGARIDGKDSQDVSALINALRTPILGVEQLLVIKFLLQQGADPNLTGNSSFTGLSGIPLHLAIAMNESTMNRKDLLVKFGKLAELAVKELLKAGAYISGRDEMGRTPLHIAAKYNNYRGAQILIEAGAKIMDRDKDGRTPLDYAESAEMIKLLKKHGAKEQ